jgi:regulator of nonsense transcripts 1
LISPFLIQDYIPHGSQGLFTQVGFNDRTQDEPTHFGLGGPLQSQVIVFYICIDGILQGSLTSVENEILSWMFCQGPMNPMYAQPFTQYTHTLNQQAQQQQQVQQQVQQQGLHNQRPRYNG